MKVRMNDLQESVPSSSFLIRPSVKVRLMGSPGVSEGNDSERDVIMAIFSDSNPFITIEEIKIEFFHRQR